MHLAAGDSVGPYEIIAPLGAGGMGEVYQARDRRLDRLVALKILMAQKLGDAERKRRFIQEAKSASALNHPNIVTIYDIGSDGGLNYLAMELVAGKPLDRLIVRGGMPLAEILRYGAQIADALSKAHAAGIVHRDLKPANVMVTPEGLVKVLDFGLAKLNQPVEQGEPEATQTFGAHTQEGTVLGTAAYMSPEQAEAKPVDGRSDVFSFGVVLYEMATGRRAFQGESQMSTMAMVLMHEPSPPGDVRPDLPPELARLITRCLQKDRDRRAQSMADVRVALDELKAASDSGKLSGPQVAAAPAASNTKTAIFAGIAAVALLAAAFFGWRAMSGGSSSGQPLQPVPLTSYPGNENQPAFSPDGNQVAFNWDGEQQDNPDIYVKSIGPGAPLRLTTDPRPDSGPQWSPDGRYIAFVRRIALDRVAVLLVSPLGGPERKVGEFYTRLLFEVPLASLCWTSDSRYLIVSGSESRNESNRMLRVAIDTGEVKTLAVAEGVADGYARAALSPDGGTLAMVLFHGSGSVELLSLSKTFEPQGSRKLAGGGDVLTIAWSADGRDLIGSAGANNPSPLFRLSVAGGNSQALAWTGPGATWPAVSISGRRLAFARSFRDTNIWQVPLDKLQRGERAMEKIASSSFREVAPRYSPDGKRLAFHSNRGGSVQIWVADADGSRAVELTSLDPIATTGTPRWSPDGKRISFDSNAGGPTEVYVINADGGKPRALTTGPTSSYITAWSHDGRWIYFTSNRTGEQQIWRISPEGGAAEQVTHNGAQGPDFSPDGKWLYFTKRDGAEGIWRMPVEGGEESRMVPAVFRYSYAVTGQGIYFVSPRAANRTSAVQFLNFATGTTTEIMKTEKPVDLGLAVSPDGRKLLFTQLDYSGQDLMLVENFR